MIEWLRPLLDRLLPINPIKALQWLADLLDALRRLRDKLGYRSTYEMLDYDAAPEIRDPQGIGAVLNRIEVGHLLQDSVGSHVRSAASLVNCQRQIPQVRQRCTQLQPHDQWLVIR